MDVTPNIKMKKIFKNPVWMVILSCGVGLFLAGCKDTTDAPPTPTTPEIVTEFNEYQTVPDEVMDAPEKFGFVRQNCWRLDNNISCGVDICYWNEDFQVFIFKGESDQFVGKGVKETGNLKLGNYTWYLNESIHKKVNFNDYVIGILPLYIFNDKEPLTAQVMENPEKYGFSTIESWYYKNFFDSERNEETGSIKLWTNGNGFFCPGTEFWNNKYYRWSSDESFTYTNSGIYEIEGQNYRVDGSTLDNSPYQITIFCDYLPKLQRARLSDKNIELGSQESPYSSYLGYATSGAFFIDVYDYIDLSDITLSYDASWIWSANERIAYNKGESYSEGRYYNCTRIAIDLATTRNYGNTRNATCTIKVKDVCGEDYTLYFNISQRGETGGGGSNNGNNGGNGGSTSEPLGADWEQFEASGYLPYWYCPSTGEKTPAVPSKTAITAYRNKSTGAYKVRWASKYYNASKGYNKITIDKEYHSVYKYNNWVSCLDYCYLEVTL